MELWLKRGAMKRIMIVLSFLILTLISNVSYAQEWWQKWDSYPRVPKITAGEVKNMMLAGEKIVFVYAGYEVDQVVCNSFYIPYTKVPPSSDGSSLTIRFPKDYWIMCY
jgi:hypothetical protein